MLVTAERASEATASEPHGIRRDEISFFSEVEQAPVHEHALGQPTLTAFPSSAVGTAAELAEVALG